MSDMLEKVTLSTVASMKTLAWHISSSAILLFTIMACIRPHLFTN